MEVVDKYGSGDQALPLFADYGVEVVKGFGGAESFDGARVVDWLRLDCSIVAALESSGYVLGVVAWGVGFDLICSPFKYAGIGQGRDSYGEAGFLLHGPGWGWAILFPFRCGRGWLRRLGILTGGDGCLGIVAVDVRFRVHLMVFHVHSRRGFGAASVVIGSAGLGGLQGCLSSVNDPGSWTYEGLFSGEFPRVDSPVDHITGDLHDYFFVQAIAWGLGGPAALRFDRLAEMLGCDGVDHRRVLLVCCCWGQVVLFVVLGFRSLVVGLLYDFQMYCFDFSGSVRSILFYFNLIFFVRGFGHVCFTFRSGRSSSVWWGCLIGHHGRTGLIVVMVGVVTSRGGVVLRRVYQYALRLQSLLFSVWF